MSDEPSGEPAGVVFSTTHWSRVLSTRGESPEARAALSDLCAVYYPPVVAFLKHEGRGEDAARELAHEFFARVLERNAFEAADPERGRFRSYVLGALKHFLANQRRSEQRQKRGGNILHQPLASPTDTSPGFDVPDPEAVLPDAVFDREWAVTLLERAFATLSTEANDTGRAAEYQALKPWLTADAGGKSQADAARELGMSETAIRVAIHRLRRRFRERVKAEIRKTVADPSDIADELQHLIAILS